MEFIVMLIIKKSLVQCQLKWHRFSKLIFIFISIFGMRETLYVLPNAQATVMIRLKKQQQPTNSIHKQ